MQFDEEAKYRVSYLALRLLFDRLLSTKGIEGRNAVVQLLDVLAGTQLAGDSTGKKYASQRDKIESFIDAEFDEETLNLINKAIDEIV